MFRGESLKQGFENAHQTPSMEQLQSWKDQGYTDIVLFGRFQPVHKGHIALMQTLRESGLNVNLVLNDKTDGAEGERNPFNPHQRQQMVNLAVPWLPSENIQHATVYLGGGGDVGNAVRRLTSIFEGIADPGKLVMAYFEKAEDRKEYLVDGEIIRDAHYVELVGQPRGQFPIQRITEEMIAEVAQYVPIDAKMFRAGIRQQDQVCYELLDPAVAAYVSEQLTRADEEGRPVGEYTGDDTISAIAPDGPL